MWSLKAPIAQTFPLELQIGMSHFHSSLRVGSAALMTLRSRAIRLPRQSVNPAMCLSIRADASWLIWSSPYPRPNSGLERTGAALADAPQDQAPDTPAK